MTDPTKPPERVWIPTAYVPPNLNEAYVLRCVLRGDREDDHEYILASSLPGTVEEIKQAIELADELHHLVSRGEGSEDQLSYLLIDLGRALAAMKKEEP